MIVVVVEALWSILYIRPMSRSTLYESNYRNILYARFVRVRVGSRLRIRVMDYG